MSSAENLGTSKSKICQKEKRFRYILTVVRIPYLAEAEHLEGGKFIDSEDSLVHHLVHKPQSAKS